MIAVLFLAASSASETRNLDGPSSEEAFGKTWSELHPLILRGTIEEVQETQGGTVWRVRVVEQLRGTPLPDGVLSVTQPQGCGPDGRCTTSSGAILNVDLLTGTEVVLAFSRPLPRVGHAGLHGARLFFPHEGVTISGRSPIATFDCDLGAGGHQRTGPEVHEIAVLRGHGPEYLVPRALVGGLRWSDFLSTLRTCQAPIDAP